MNRTSPVSEFDEAYAPSGETVSRLGGRFVQGSALERAIDELLSLSARVTTVALQSPGAPLVTLADLA